MHDDDILEPILARIRKRERDFAENVQVGDIVFSNETKKFTHSEFQYISKRRGYKVLSIRDGTACCESDISGETAYLNPLSASHVMRGDKKILEFRSELKWQYLSNHPDETDKYGHPVTKNVVYSGLIEEYHSGSEDMTLTERRRFGGYLVELTCNFRDGVPGNLINVNLNDLEIIEINGELVPEDQR